MSSPSSTRKALEGVKWKGKVKISSLFIAARQRTIVSPSQLYLFDITGVVRELAVGEAPCDYLLCPSTKLDQIPHFGPHHRRWLQRDPYQLSELYNSLRDQCLNRKRQRELAIAKRKREEGASYRPSEDEKGPVYGTLRSPVKKNEFLAFNAEKLLTFRFTSEYHYVRFLFVLTSVMGYDQKGPRPFGGYPPVDPRNKLLFATLPPTAAYDLSKVESRLPYIYCHGNFLGRDAEDKLQISLKNCFMCITNEMVMPVRSSGTIPVWLEQCHIMACYYNYKAARPYIALISDPGEVDFIFSPSLPEFGVYLPKFPFSPSMQVQRLVFLLHQCCFANSDVRRVITFTEIKETTIHGFVDRVERERQRPLELRLRLPHGRSPICPEGHVHIRGLYSTVQAASAEIDRHVVENAAVPLYDTNPNNTPFSAEHLQLMRSLVEQRQLEDELVGLALESVTSLAMMGGGGHPTSVSVSGEEGGGGGPGTSTLPIEASSEDLLRSVAVRSSAESGRRRGRGGLVGHWAAHSLSAMGRSGRKSSGDARGIREEEEEEAVVRLGSVRESLLVSSGDAPPLESGREEAEDRERHHSVGWQGSRAANASLSDPERWRGGGSFALPTGSQRPGLATSVPEDLGFMFSSAAARRRRRRPLRSHPHPRGGAALQEGAEEDAFLHSQAVHAMSYSRPPPRHFLASGSFFPPPPWPPRRASLPSPPNEPHRLFPADEMDERQERERQQWLCRSVGDEVLRDGMELLSSVGTIDRGVEEDAAAGEEEEERRSITDGDEYEENEEGEEEEEYDEEEDRYVYGPPAAEYLSRDAIDLLPTPDTSSLLVTIPHANTSSADAHHATGPAGKGLRSATGVASHPSSPSSPFSGERRKSKKSTNGSTSPLSSHLSSPHGSHTRGRQSAEHTGSPSHPRVQQNFKIIRFGSVEET